MVASTLLQHSAPDNPIFQFMDKKWAEGKHFYVYTVAGAAKFLRVCYARVKAYLAALDSGANTAAEPNAANTFSRFAKKASLTGVSCYTLFRLPNFFKMFSFWGLTCICRFAR